MYLFYFYLQYKDFFGEKGVLCFCFFIFFICSNIFYLIVFYFLLVPLWDQTMQLLDRIYNTQQYITVLLCTMPVPGGSLQASVHGRPKGHYLASSCYGNHQYPAMLLTMASRGLNGRVRSYLRSRPLHQETGNTLQLRLVQAQLLSPSPEPNTVPLPTLPGVWEGHSRKYKLNSFDT